MESSTGNSHRIELDADHPGFRDREYRRRRDTIAAAALEHSPGQPIPPVDYTLAERLVWRDVNSTLAPLHARLVHPELRRCSRELGLGDAPLPQFETVNEQLSTTGFRFEPVPGLVDPRTFLVALSEGRFLATQYMRHASRPLYTPEPDVIHELIGHAASLRHPDVCELSRAFGTAAARADADRLERIIRVYWWVLEFGLVEHEGQPLAIGAGLLSSAAELGAFTTEPELGPMEPDSMAATPFDPTSINPRLFVATSWAEMCDRLTRWLAA